MSSRSDKRPSFTIMGMAAAGGRCRGDQAPSPFRRRWPLVTGRRGDRLWRFGAHISPFAPACRCRGYHLCQGSAAECSLFAGDRDMDPGSRICFEDYATPAFKQLWANMARESFRTYQTLLGLPGDPVEFIDDYFVSENPDATPHHIASGDKRPKFADLQGELIGDLIPRSEVFAPGRHPFGAHYLRRNTFMMFNLSDFTRTLIADFHSYGAKIEIDEFHTPADFSRLSQKTLINATGYGARALFGDQSITPVRASWPVRFRSRRFTTDSTLTGSTSSSSGRPGLSSAWPK